MKDLILNNLAKIRKNLLMYEIILDCYEDEERHEMIKFLNSRLNELLNDINKYEVNSNTGDYTWLKNKIENDSYTFADCFLSIKDYVDSRCRMLSIITLQNMSYEELITFKENFINYVKDFKTIDDAATYSCYHSGLILTDFIDSLLEYTKSAMNEDYKKYIPVEYLEENRNEIVIDLKKWVDIFEHLKKIMKSIKPKESEEYASLIKKYNKLLLFYFIIVSSPSYHS